jgi:hypothetical protein
VQAAADINSGDSEKITTDGDNLVAADCGAISAAAKRADGFTSARSALAPIA